MVKKPNPHIIKHAKKKFKRNLQMINQNFSSRSFLRLINKQDFAVYTIGKTKEEVRQSMDRVETTCRMTGYNFQNFQKYRMSHGDVHYPSNLVDELVLRKLDNNIKRILSVSLTDRNRVVPQIKTLLQEEGDFWVQKLDISRFFESVDRELLIKKISDDYRVSFETKQFLKLFFSHPSISGLKGLPRGVALSSTLADIYMHDFDNQCKSLDGCYYYARYVDDIILLFFKEPTHQVSSLKLPPGLTFNKDKSRLLFHPSKGPAKTKQNENSIVYLGYEFSFISKGQNRPSSLSVGISKKKINRLKSRVTLALFEFCKTQNYRLLKSRLTFLASNYKIKEKQNAGNLYAGIFFNNQLIDDDRLQDLKEIDEFINRAIFSRTGSLGKKLYPLLTNQKRRELCRISLLSGFKNKIVRPFTPNELRIIKSVWPHA